MHRNNPYYTHAVELGGEINFSAVWQANIRGVDLNHNYDALWEEGIAASPDAKLRPGPTQYAGSYPESEPESHALAEFTRKIDPALVLAYHSQGREIYYDFNGKIPYGTYELGMEFARLSGYELRKPEGFAGFGGYKDWFIDKFNRPGFTIEMGRGKNPIGLDQLITVLDENTPVMLSAAKGM